MKNQPLRESIPVLEGSTTCKRKKVDNYQKIVKAIQEKLSSSSSSSSSAAETANPMKEKESNKKVGLYFDRDPVTILHISVVGSVGKGMSSPDSDYDIKVLVVHSQRDYMLQNIQESWTIPKFTINTTDDTTDEKELEITAIDVLRLFDYIQSTNLSGYEFFAGVTIYTTKIVMAMKELWKKNHHYEYHSMLVPQYYGILYAYVKKLKSETKLQRRRRLKEQRECQQQKEGNVQGSRTTTTITTRSDEKQNNKNDNGSSSINKKRSAEMKLSNKQAMDMVHVSLLLHYIAFSDIDVDNECRCNSQNSSRNEKDMDPMPPFNIFELINKYRENTVLFGLTEKTKYEKNKNDNNDGNDDTSWMFELLEARKCNKNDDCLFLNAVMDLAENALTTACNPRSVSTSEVVSTTTRTAKEGIVTTVDDGNDDDDSKVTKNKKLQTKKIFETYFLALLREEENVEEESHPSVTI